MKSADGPAQAAAETRPSSSVMNRERCLMAAIQNWLLRSCRLQFAREQFERDIPMGFGGCVVKAPANSMRMGRAMPDERLAIL
jgi:hypothetical protein